MLLYKFTDEDNKTYGETKWGKGVVHEAPGGGELCTSAWIHAYTSPLVAVFMDPVHGGFTDDDGNPNLWLCHGNFGINDGVKVGLRRLTTVKIIDIPAITMEQRMEVAIRIATRIYKGETWQRWAKSWRYGGNRLVAAASHADAAYDAADTAYDAAYHAAYAAYYAAYAVAYDSVHATATAVASAASFHTKRNTTMRLSEILRDVINGKRKK